MNGWIIFICFFYDFHRAILNAKIAVEATVGENFGVLSAGRQNNFFYLRGDVFAEFNSAFSGEGKSGNHCAAQRQMRDMCGASHFQLGFPYRLIRLSIFAAQGQFPDERILVLFSAKISL